MLSRIGRYLAWWLAMLLVAVANGAVRDSTYGSHLDNLTAQQISSISAMVMLGLVIRIFVRRNPPSSAREAVGIGLGWMLLTVAFEFLFFHYTAGHPWPELLANYKVWEGRLWVFVLLWVAVAPYFLSRSGRRF